MFLFYISFVGFLSFRSHFILLLMILELVFLNLFLVIFIFSFYYSFEFFFLVFFLVLGVCEGVLGLSVLVFVIRKIGCDYILFYDLY